MTDETFISRWSRRKRELAESKDKPAGAPRKGKAGAIQEDSAKPASATPEATSDPPFDISKLPPIESITAGSDIRAFLQSGVPAELTKAALRRAWSTDPAIRDFIGLAENQWDFCDPTAIPGFGTLGESEASRLVAQALGNLGETSEKALQALAEPKAEETTGLPQPAEPEGSPGISEDRQPAPLSIASAEEARAAEPAAGSAAPEHAERKAEPAEDRRRRGHGRALPR